MSEALKAVEALAIEATAAFDKASREFNAAQRTLAKRQAKLNTAAKRMEELNAAANVLRRMTTGLRVVG